MVSLIAEGVAGLRVSGAFFLTTTLRKTCFAFQRCTRLSTFCCSAADRKFPDRKKARHRRNLRKAVSAFQTPLRVFGFTITPPQGELVLLVMIVQIFQEFLTI
jgi:hypothetical protein